MEKGLSTKERVYHALYGYGAVVALGETDKGVATATVAFDNFVDKKIICKTFLRIVSESEEPTKKAVVRRTASGRGQLRQEIMLSMLRSSAPQPVLNLDFIAAGETHFGKPWHRFSVTVQELRRDGYVLEDSCVDGSYLHQTRLVSEPA